MPASPLRRPSKESIGRIAENQPHLLNLLIAYFVFEWQSVSMGTPPHGVDQLGRTCHVPDYVKLWTDADRSGINTAVNLLLQCPMVRSRHEPGYLTHWLEKVSH